uniref:Cytochrome c biogenesis protein Ccs1 n=1 Tax=Palmaria palmata TaxID=2822 RepID=A0A455TME0_PALPL|nr:Cytochrome c biogenesis protein ccs1 [Palmaria palmata]
MQIIYKVWRWRTIKQLGNLTFAIILLLLIAAVSVLGTIIEQDHSIDYYQTNYPIHSDTILDVNWVVIKRLHIDQLYTSWSYLALLVLFGASLIVCTFSTQLPSLRNARRWKLKKSLSLSKPLYKQNTVKALSTTSNIYCLSKLSYHVFYQNNFIYSYKGLIGKVAPVFVHVSIILLLFGSMTSLFFSFLIQEMVPVKETFNFQNVVHAGYLSTIPSQIIGRVNSFHIEYYQDKSAKQFYSSLSLVDHTDNKNVKQRISVNNPLYFKGLTIYQTDWQINGLKVLINNKESLQIPMMKIKKGNNTYWFSNISYNNQVRYSFVLQALDGSIFCYNGQGQLIRKLDVKQNNIIDYLPIQVLEIITSTGLQIKKDPGIPILYSSFAMLIISTFISYISYSQIWISVEADQLLMTGITNRGQIKLEEDIFKLQKFLK